MFNANFSEKLRNSKIWISDSEVLYTEAFTTVSAKYGKTFTWELKASLLGFQGHECAEKITKTLDLPITKDEFMAECVKVYEVLFPKVQLMPGKIYDQVTLACILLSMFAWVQV